MTGQFPVPAYRVVFSASGMYMAAAVVTDQSAVVEHQLYWGPAYGRAEALYLTAILNSSVLTEAVRPMQARGEHNPRHFDKYVFQLPIPAFNRGDAVHARLVAFAERAEHVVAVMTLPEVRFQTQRKYIRQALVRDGVAQNIDATVKVLLDLG